MPRTLMRRVIFGNDEMDKRRAWLRLRDQGEEVYLTYKEATAAKSSVASTLEGEVSVGSFEAAWRVLEAIGLKTLRYQENYREEWELDGVRYAIDTWPDIPTFVEVEATDEESVRLGAKRIGLDFEDASFGSVDEVYRSGSGRDILNESRLTFAD